jgi:hypothetical protein
VARSLLQEVYPEERDQVRAMWIKSRPPQMRIRIGHAPLHDGRLTGVFTHRAQRFKKVCFNLRAKDSAGKELMAWYRNSIMRNC